MVKTSLDVAQEVLNRLHNTDDNNAVASALAKRMAVQGSAISPEHAVSGLRDSALRDNIQQILTNTDSEQRKRGIISGLTGAGIAGSLVTLGSLAGGMRPKTHLPNMIISSIGGAAAGGLGGYLHGRNKAKENAIRAALLEHAHQ